MAKNYKGIDQHQYKALCEKGLVTSSDLFNWFYRQQLQQFNEKSKNQQLESYLKRDENVTLEVFSDGGVIKFNQPKSYAKKSIVIIDWLNFTVNEESYNTKYCVLDTDLILNASLILERIFGFGVTTVRPNGAFFYSRSYELGDNYGLLCHGGQNRTILVSINGTGLEHAQEGWQQRLYHFLETAIQPTITRIDIAHDIFDAPMFYIDHWLQQYDKGMFQNGNRPLSINQAGNWLTPNENGRTLYLGKRTNGLFCRIYEKGLQLQSPTKPTWLRIEVEFKSVDRILPHDILINPEQYFSGAFPAFRSFNRQFKRIETYQHEVIADIEHRTKWAKRQSGGFIKLLTELGHEPNQIVSMLEGKNVPKAFQQKFLESSKTSITNNPTEVINDFSMLENINLNEV